MTLDAKLRIEKSVSEFLGLLESPTPVRLPDYLSRIDPDIREAVEESCRMALSIQSVFSSRPRGPSEAGVGKQLGPFKLLRFLGEGGMGRVYLARQDALDRNVAVKVIRGDRSHRAEFRRRFDRESRIIASLDHPGIVKIIDRGEDDEQIYFVMEFVDGPSLREVIRNVQDGVDTADSTAILLHPRHAASQVRAARLISEVASALSHAHGRGISHRDLKPENIQIGAGGRPRIIDFGLAADSMTASSLAGDGLIGTAAYLPPTGRKQTTGVERDLWALGVILYEVVTLRRPFTGNTVPEISAEIQRGSFPFAASVYPSIAKDLDRIIRKALAPDAADRYGNVSELEQDLGRFLAGAPVLAGESSLAAIIRRHVRRHRLAYTITTAFLLVALGGFGLARRLQNQAFEEQLLREATTSTHAPSPKLRLVELARRKNSLERLAARPGIGSSTREEVGRVREEIKSEVAEIYESSRKRIEVARGTRPGVPIEDYRPPSEPDLFQALALASEAKTVAGDWISEDPVAALFPTLTITADCDRANDAVVRVCPINLMTGVPQPAVVTSHLPMSAVAVPPGLSMIAIEVAGFGRAEYIRDFVRSGSIEIRPRIVPDQLVRGRIPMAEIPAGTYRVGQKDDNADNVYRNREVTVEGFLIDVYETTCAQYREFLEANPVEKRPATWGDDLAKYDHDWDDRPMWGVSWMAAQRYAEWRGKRLPSWIEWQIAIRGPDSFLYPWGREPTTIEELKTSASVGFPPRTLPPPVGSAPRDRSPFGVMDGFGSVREWTCLPYLTNVERVIHPNSGWRMTVSNSHTRTAWEPRSLAAGVTPVSEAAPESEVIGVRCLRSLKAH